MEKIAVLTVRPLPSAGTEWQLQSNRVTIVQDRESVIREFT
jgi:hypothetical protein